MNTYREVLAKSEKLQKSLKISEAKRIEAEDKLKTYIHKLDMKNMEITSNDSLTNDVQWLLESTTAALERLQQGLDEVYFGVGGSKTKAYDVDSLLVTAIFDVSGQLSLSMYRFR